MNMILLGQDSAALLYLRRGIRCGLRSRSHPVFAGITGGGNIDVNVFSGSQLKNEVSRRVKVSFYFVGPR
jgi:hypothetical protein